MSPESTPHISAARDHAAALLAALREARLGREADTTVLSNFSNIVRGVDESLEAIEVR